MAHEIDDGVGLAVVVDCPDAIVEQVPEILHRSTELTEISVCFVHGLNGSRKTTWTKDNVFWPKQLLPEGLPEARILTFGYHGQIGHFWSPTTVNKLDDHCKAFIQDLNNKRKLKDATERPIIFVAHSLGGLVCARSLVISSSDSPDKETALINETKGVAFLGTPFKGSNKTEWAKVAERLFELFHTGSTNKDLRHNLEVNSQKLATLGEEFPKLLKNNKESSKTPARIMCFFEGDPMKPGGTIVDRTSAQLPGEDELSLNADHKNMCKFSSKTDNNYEKVLGLLQGWVEEIKNAKKEEVKSQTSQFHATTHFTGPSYGSNLIGQDNSTGGTHHVGAGSTFNFGAQKD